VSGIGVALGVGVGVGLAVAVGLPTGAECGVPDGVGVGEVPGGSEGVGDAPGGSENTGVGVAPAGLGPMVAPPLPQPAKTAAAARAPRTT